MLKEKEAPLAPWPFVGSVRDGRGRDRACCFSHASSPLFARRLLSVRLLLINSTVSHREQHTHSLSYVPHSKVGRDRVLLSRSRGGGDSTKVEGLEL